MTDGTSSPRITIPFILTLRYNANAGPVPAGDDDEDDDGFFLVFLLGDSNDDDTASHAAKQRSINSVLPQGGPINITDAVIVVLLSCKLLLRTQLRPLPLVSREGSSLLLFVLLTVVVVGTKHGHRTSYNC